MIGLTALAFPLAVGEAVVLQVLLIVEELLPYALRLLLLGLALANLAYGVLYPAVRLLEHLLRLFLCLVEYLLTGFLHIGHTGLIARYGLLEFLLPLVDGLPFAFPVAFVADDVLEILVALYVVGAYDVGGVLDNLLGQSCLPGYLYGERASRPSDGKTEEGFHQMAVIEHGTVGDMVVAVGEMLEVLVVGGDDRPRPSVEELLQTALGDGTTNLWFRTRSELIDEDKCPGVGLLYHILHVEQMGGIGTEVVLQTLFVANVYHKVIEDAYLRAVANGNGQSALEHILQQCHRLEAHALSAGVRS